MFRISFCVDDKGLADLLHSLTGRRIIDLDVRPVANGHAPEKPTGKARPNGGHGNSKQDDFIVVLRQAKAITPETAKDAAAAVGASRTSYQHFLREAVKAGHIRKGKKVGINLSYTWTDK